MQLSSKEISSYTIKKGAMVKIDPKIIYSIILDADTSHKLDPEMAKEISILVAQGLRRERNYE